MNDELSVYEDALVGRYAVVTGQRVPIGLRDILHVLTHPDVIDFAWEYLDAHYEVDFIVSSPSGVPSE